jgi:hypothetical protein
MRQNVRGEFPRLSGDCIDDRERSLPTSFCPICRYEMDSATCVEKELAEPSAGDLSVCLNCGELLQFNEILVLRLLPTTQRADIDEESQKLLTRASELIRKRGRIH